MVVVTGNLQTLKKGQDKMMAETMKRINSNLFANTNFAANLFNKNFNQLQTKFQSAQDNLNKYFSTAEQSIQNSFNTGIESLNKNYQAAIKQVADIATPFREASMMAQKDYLNYLGLGDKSMDQIQQELQSTPGYQFQLEQGQQAIERSAAARGNLVSGNTLTELTKFGQGMAQSVYQDRLQNLLGIMQQTNPILASLTQTQSSLQAGLGEQTLNAERMRGGYLADLQTQRGAGLAGLDTQQANLQSQLTQQRAGLLEQARQADVASQTSRLNQERQAQASGFAALAGASSNVAGNLLSAEQNRLRNESNERIAGAQLAAGYLSR